MSVRRRYTNEEGTMFVTRHNLDDIYKDFNAKKVLKEKRDRIANQRCKDLFSQACKMMADDMIEQQTVTVFPRHQFGFFRVADLSKFMKMDKYRLDIRHDFKVYGPVVVLNEMIRRVNGGRHYGLKLVGPHMKKIRQLRENGMRWK